MGFGHVDVHQLNVPRVLPGAIGGDAQVPPRDCLRRNGRYLAHGPTDALAEVED